jgi:protein-disulfide isomerase
MNHVRIGYALSLTFVALVSVGASCNRNNSGSATPDRPNVESNPVVAAQTQGNQRGDRVTEVAGFDTTSLSAVERDLLWNVSNDLLSPCGDPHSLAVCARDRGCAECRPALRFLSRRVQDGFDAERLGELVRARFSRDAVVRINVEGAPVRGAATAPITLVEFSDYECPHCGSEAPILRDIEREFGERLRVIHMHFPISFHLRAMPAARAAWAASRQGKFWEYHDLLFANQSALDDASLVQYATRAGLDVARFRADSAGPESEAAVARDRREGERLQIESTPSIFINGRAWPHALHPDRAQLREWINDELELHGQPPAPPPAAEQTPPANHNG